jgi:hypothetical protein
MGRVRAAGMTLPPPVNRTPRQSVRQLPAAVESADRFVRLLQQTIQARDPDEIRTDEVQLTLPGAQGYELWAPSHAFGDIRGP